MLHFLAPLYIFDPLLYRGCLIHKLRGLTSINLFFKDVNLRVTIAHFDDGGSAEFGEIRSILMRCKATAGNGELFPLGLFKDFLFEVDFNEALNLSDDLTLDFGVDLEEELHKLKDAVLNLTKERDDSKTGE